MFSELVIGQLGILISNIEVEKRFYFSNLLFLNLFLVVQQ